MYLDVVLVNYCCVILTTARCNGSILGVSNAIVQSQFALKDPGIYLLWVSLPDSRRTEENNLNIGEILGNCALICI